MDKDATNEGDGAIGDDNVTGEQTNRDGGDAPKKNDASTHVPTAVDAPDGGGAKPSDGSDAAAQPKPLDCVPGSKRCTKQQGVETCTTDGVWGGGVPCDFVCTGAGTCSGQCKPQDKRCDPAQALVPQTCDDSGTWVSAGPACTNLCSSGSCAGSCSPGEKQCGANHVPETCDDQGTWQPRSACPFVCSGAGICAGECKPGTKDCGTVTLKGLPATPRLCGDDGKYTAQAACSNQACSVGSCVGECVAGVERCSASGAPQTCNASGKWVDGGLSSCAPRNLAAGATVTASSTTEYGNFSIGYLVDGDLGKSYSSAQRDDGNNLDHDGCVEWVAVTQPIDMTFSKVVLIPRRDNAGDGYPVSFMIQLWDGEKWQDRQSGPVQIGPFTSSAPQVISWGHSDTTTAVRLCAKQLAVDFAGHFFLQLAELQLNP